MLSKDLINRILEEIGLESIRGNELEEGHRNGSTESAEWKREELRQENGAVS